jgi:uncharacterized membrane protein
MNNRIVGSMIVIIALLIGFIIFSFNTALTDIVNASCSHGAECTMWGSINFQTNVSAGIMVFVFLIGVYLIFFGDDKKGKKASGKEEAEVEKIVPRKVTKEEYEDILKELGPDERIVVEKIIEEGGTMFQGNIVEKTSFPKAKVTRILDRLEGKKIVERKRRGMSNVIILTK